MPVMVRMSVTLSSLHIQTCAHRLAAEGVQHCTVYQGTCNERLRCLCSGHVTAQKLDDSKDEDVLDVLHLHTYTMELTQCNPDRESS